MYACVWEVVIWCMGVGVKADRTRIVIILVPHILPINSFKAFHVLRCGA